MIKSLFSFIFAAIMWVQVPQWSDDWSKCAVDVPDVACHWYITAPDSTMGVGFSWANAPWFSASGLRDVGTAVVLYMQRNISIKNPRYQEFEDILKKLNKTLQKK